MNLSSWTAVQFLAWPSAILRGQGLLQSLAVPCREGPHIAGGAFHGGPSPTLSCTPTPGLKSSTPQKACAAALPLRPSGHHIPHALSRASSVTVQALPPMDKQQYSYVGPIQMHDYSFSSTPSGRPPPKHNRPPIFSVLICLPVTSSTQMTHVPHKDKGHLLPRLHSPSLSPSLEGWMLILSALPFPRVPSPSFS